MPEQIKSERKAGKDQLLELVHRAPTYPAGAAGFWLRQKAPPRLRPHGREVNRGDRASA